MKRWAFPLLIKNTNVKGLGTVLVSLRNPVLRAGHYHNTLYIWFLLCVFLIILMNTIQAKFIQLIDIQIYFY